MHFRRLILPLVMLAAADALPAREQLNAIAAVVNGKVITKSEVGEARKMMEQMIMVTVPPGGERDQQLADARAKALDQLVERELVLYEFEKLGGVVKPSMVEEDIEKIIRDRFAGDRDKFIAELKKTGMSLSKFEDLRRKFISVKVMRSQQGRDIVYCTPEDVRAAYEKHKDGLRTPGTVEVRMITIVKKPIVEPIAEPGIPLILPDPEQRRKLADEIHAKLVDGADFSEMAKKFSQDRMAEEGGYRGVIAPGDKKFREDLAGVAFTLKTGQISPTIEDAYNIYIIKAVKREMGPAPSLDDPETKQTMQDAALAHLRNQAVVRWLDHLKETAQIKIYE